MLDWICCTRYFLEAARAGGVKIKGVLLRREAAGGGRGG